MSQLFQGKTSVTILKNVVTFEGDKLYLFTLFIW